MIENISITDKFHYRFQEFQDLEKDYNDINIVMQLIDYLLMMS